MRLLRSFIRVIMAAKEYSSSSKSSEKLVYPAAERNKEPILQVLKRFLLMDHDERPFLLEIASGSGQHLAHFAPNFPQIIFQPSEYEKSLFPSLKYYADNCSTKNIRQPILVDITRKLSDVNISENSVDFLYNANMVHISPYACTTGLFENAGLVLKKDALMIMYGPFAKDGVITPQSNIDFNASLISQDPSWGLRDIADLIVLGERNNLTLIDTVEMPSNNKILVWKRN